MSLVSPLSDLPNQFCYNLWCLKSVVDVLVGAVLIYTRDRLTSKGPPCGVLTVMLPATPVATPRLSVYVGEG